MQSYNATNEKEDVFSLVMLHTFMDHKEESKNQNQNSTQMLENTTESDQDVHFQTYYKLMYAG